MHLPEAEAVGWDMAWDACVLEPCSDTDTVRATLDMFGNADILAH